MTPTMQPEASQNALKNEAKKQHEKSTILAPKMLLEGDQNEYGILPGRAPPTIKVCSEDRMLHKGCDIDLRNLVLVTNYYKMKQKNTNTLIQNIYPNDTNNTFGTLQKYNKKRSQKKT